jgi:glycosyltransferase involved in cell wall biosynthesis
MIVGVNGRFLAATPTGVQRFARAVLEQLSRRADVALFLPRNAVVPEALRPRVRVHRGTLRGTAWEQFELPRMISGRCDVLFNPAHTAPLRIRRQLVMVHDVLPLTQPHWFAPAFSAWYGYMTPRLLARCEIILTSSHYCADQIREISRGRTPNVIVVPQGIAPFEAPADAEAVARVRAERLLGSRYVLALGGGDRRKNVAFAADVVRRYRRLYDSSLTLAVVGRAETHVHGRAAQELPIEDVRHLGSVGDDELRALYTGASALLFPSLGEGFGRPPLEALCCGTPVLASDYAAGRETLTDTPARRLPLDVDLWTHALHDVLQSGLRPSSETRNALCARWSWPAAADAVLAACALARAPVAAGVV